MESYLYIDYSNRYHKKIARKMIANIVKEYSNCLGRKLDYVGMGSLFFEDFIQLYETGCIEGMKSIEYMTGEDGLFNEQKYKRFMQNRPYDSIEIIPKYACDAIEELTFENNTVLWLDYEVPIRRDTIEDMANVIRKMTHSGLLISVTNTYVPHPYKSGRGELDTAMVKELFADMVTPQTAQILEDIDWDNYTFSIRKMVNPYYRKLVKEKSEANGKHYELYQISSIEYRDSVRFVIDIWALIDRDETDCEAVIEHMSSIFEAGEHNIDMTILTEREKEILKKRIDQNPIQIAEDFGVDVLSIEKYIKYRKYCNL